MRILFMFLIVVATSCCNTITPYKAGGAVALGISLGANNLSPEQRIAVSLARDVLGVVAESGVEVSKKAVLHALDDLGLDEAQKIATANVLAVCWARMDSRFSLSRLGLGRKREVLRDFYKGLKAGLEGDGDS